MSDLRKHRLESLNFEHDFAAEIASGDSLSGTPTVKVLRLNSSTSAWDDLTSQFGTPSPSIDGTKVVFTLGAATGTDQDGGEYRVLIECDTANGEHLVGEVQAGRTYRTPILTVSEDADSNAP